MGHKENMQRIKGFFHRNKPQAPASTDTFPGVQIVIGDIMNDIIGALSLTSSEADDEEYENKAREAVEEATRYNPPPRVVIAPQKPDLTPHSEDEWDDNTVNLEKDLISPQSCGCFDQKGRLCVYCVNATVKVPGKHDSKPVFINAGARIGESDSATELAQITPPYRVYGPKIRGVSFFDKSSSPVEDDVREFARTYELNDRSG